MNHELKCQDQLDTTMKNTASDPARKYLAWFLGIILFLFIGFTVLALYRYDMSSTGLVPIIVGPSSLLPVYRKARSSVKSAVWFWALGACWVVILAGGTLMLELLHVR